MDNSLHQIIEDMGAALFIQLAFLEDRGLATRNQILAALAMADLSEGYLFTQNILEKEFPKNG